ncbi:cytochrome P450 [Lentzea sp. NPDC059081]|uniref:cytochrome P450 n=1 Tax=Lentzea sp. NPDC059081 TaxID=3346719 RepID=UPI003695F56E
MEAGAVGPDSKCPMDIVTESFVHNPYPTLAAMREATPAFPVLANGYRMWVITRYHDVRRVLADHSSLKDLLNRRHRISGRTPAAGDAARLKHASRRSVLERDGADHRRLRAVLAPEFTEEAVARHAPRITELVGSLLDGLPADEPVDLLARFIRPFVSRMIGEFVGLAEEDLRDFPLWVDRMVTGTPAEISDAGYRMFLLSQRMVAHKRRFPADDVYTRLVRMREEGRLDEEELVSTFMVLLVGGSEPINATANTLLLLLLHPGQLDALRADFGKIDAAIDEAVRMESPFRMLPPRYREAPLELDGVVVPATDLIVPSLACANRDPDQFTDPDVFDIARSTPGVLAFGHGPHRCPGIGLGRLEARIALTALLERFPEVSLAVPPDRLEWRPGFFMRRLETFPVVLGGWQSAAGEKSTSDHNRTEVLS